MPGAYAHFSIINQAYTKVDSSFSPPVRDALDSFFKFCDLGAVSPDYPYLTLWGSSSKPWADAMHYQNTVRLVRDALVIIKNMEDGDAKLKAIAWLLGYASHVVGDCVIHPVVNWITMGSYTRDPVEHRDCEAHQDAYIFKKVMGIGVNAAEYLDTGVTACTAQDGGLDPAIQQVWEQAAKSAHPGLFGQAPPTIDEWHRNYSLILDKMPEVLKFLPFSRHIQAMESVTYPDDDELDHRFIDRLETPAGTSSYEEIFNRAVGQVVRVWKEIDLVLRGETSSHLPELGEPNLDTGVDDQSGSCVFWLRNEGKQA